MPLRLFALIAVVLNLPAADPYIWIEGEHASSRQLAPHPWYDQVKFGQLSGGAWASNFGDRDGQVAYSVEVASAGTYALWIRANPIIAKLAWTLNGSEERAADFSQAIDQVNLAADDQPDLRFVAWIKVGDVALKQGTNAVAFRMHSDNQHHGGLDCFVFAAKPFAPMGARKPGTKSGLAEPGSWAFEPDADAFDPQAMLDLRSLNEREAGMHGWIQATADGGFALGDATPVRFWAANSGVASSPVADDLATHARFLAKRGINMVRFHGSLWPKRADQSVTDIDAAELDRMQRMVAAMKREGIYTTISPYWAIPAEARQTWKLPDHPTGNMPGLLFWDETLQAAYRNWIRALLTAPNPHGKPLGKEPALAILQIQNEDSLLFWTLGAITGEEKRRLGRHQARWLIATYGSLAKARAAWQETAAEGDDLAAGVVGLVGLWEYGQAASAGKTVRMADQLQWLSATMRAFNQSIDEFVHQELRCPVLINAGNWCTANQITMLDCERWSYAANQVQGKNHYIGGVHVNPTEAHKSGYLVSKGDFFTDPTCLLEPRKLATNLKQPPGMPFIIPESTWVSPVSHQSEGPFLVAAYSALTGVDAYYWFALGGVGYDRTITKWQAANPSIMGGWPAAALMFRQGYVKKGQAAVHEERTLDDLWNARGMSIAEDESFDPNRHPGSFAKESTLRSAVDPLAFLVGPVEVVYGGDPAKSRAVDLAKYIDAPARSISSITGELRFDHGRGVCTVDAPRAKGACGFLGKAGAIALTHATITCANDYATLLIVPLDGRDLVRSSKVLVQATTRCRPYGWKQSPATFQDNEQKHTFQGFRIDDTGQEPWNVVQTKATVRLANPALTKGTVLDANGMLVRVIAVRADGDGVSVELPTDAIHLVLE
ncbi:MAG: hypothetical protein H0W72_10375 [Planctomycetes bacterium]|nr:hypothetical protein [Planctomycetota bacterium]